MAKKELKPEEFNRPFTIKAPKGLPLPGLPPLIFRAEGHELGLKMNRTRPSLFCCRLRSQTTPDIWMH
jgi:hypothetical protein